MHFSKQFLPQNFSALARYANDGNRFFMSLFTLADSDTEVIKLRNGLANLQRKQNEPIGVILLKIG